MVPLILSGTVANLSPVIENQSFNQTMNSPTHFADLRAIDLSTALPGPVAAARMADLGAEVIKVEPPWGDLFEEVSPEWYREINRKKTIVRRDLKSGDNRKWLDRKLKEADLLVLSNRPSALERLGLEQSRLKELFPRLCCVAIIGEMPPRAEQSGHDLTYQAKAGLLDPPRMPRFLLADLMGVERAIQSALLLLLERERSGRGGWTWVSLTEAAAALYPIVQHRVTHPDQLLGGGSPRYGYYRSKDGWITLVALEERLWQQFLAAVGRTDLEGKTDTQVRSELEGLFVQRDSSAWQKLAEEHRLPLQAV